MRQEVADRFVWEKVAPLGKGTKFTQAELCEGTSIKSTPSITQALLRMTFFKYLRMTAESGDKGFRIVYTVTSKMPVQSGYASETQVNNG